MRRRWRRCRELQVGVAAAGELRRGEAQEAEYGNCTPYFSLNFFAGATPRSLIPAGPTMTSFLAVDCWKAVKARYTATTAATTAKTANRFL